MPVVRTIVLTVLLLITSWLIAVPKLAVAGPLPAATAGPSAGPSAGPLPGAVDGRWGWPLEGGPAVGRAFTPPATAYSAGHRGADLIGGVDQPVLAAAAGEVAYAGMLAGRGVVVVVHGDLRTTYEPVNATVRVGQKVALGGPLGTLVGGHPGCAGPACLHWGLRRGATYLDPLGLVRRAPGVLLPLRVPGPGSGPGSGSGSGPGSGSNLAVPPAGGGLALPEPAAGRPPQSPDQPGARLAEALRPSAGTPTTGTPTGDSTWAKVSQQVPLTSAAVLSLLAGLALLVRRPAPTDPAPHQPGSAQLLAVPALADPTNALTDISAGPAPGTDAAPVGLAQVIQLPLERERRRAAG